MNIRITETENGLRIDKFLTGQFPQFSRAYLQKLIKGTEISVNDKKVKQGYILKVGDSIEINLPEQKNISLNPDSGIKFEVLYEDENVVVVNKPADLTVHPSENDPDKTLVNGLLAKYPDIRNVGDNLAGPDQENLRPGIVHRLDRDTSGVMIVARNNNSFQFLKNQFKTRNAVKKYIALVAGDITKENGVIDFPIARRRKIPTKQIAVKTERQACAGRQARGKIREAVTEYKVLRHLSIDKGKFTLVEVFPKTGRLHQIRVHFSAIGHPVAGDAKYGGKGAEIKGLKRQFLHAESLKINIPSKGNIDGKPKIFKSPLPKDLAKFL